MPQPQPITKLTALMGKYEANTLLAALEDDDNLADMAVSIWRSDDDRWILEIYPEPGLSNEACRAHINDKAQRLGIKPISFEVEVLEPRDWIAEGLKHLGPVTAGRFLVHGSHVPKKRHTGGISLEINAGQAFGTGHHETTRGCLIAFDNVLKRFNPHHIFDLGCGCGTLAIAAASVVRKPVLASDMDPIAVTVTRHNARDNNVSQLIDTVCATGTRHPIIQAAAPFDLIFANILAKPLMKLSPDIAPLLARDGILILSGLLDHQAPGICARYRTRGLVVKKRLSLNGWTTLTLTR